MEMELSRKNAIILRKVMQLVLEHLKRSDNKTIKFRFAYAINRNKQNLEHENSAINESISLIGLQEDIDKLNEFEQKRLGLNMSFCDKDEQGRPIIRFNDATGENFYVISKEKAEEFNLDLEKLKTEYKEILDKKTDIDKKFNEIMDEKVKVDICKINIDLIPDDPFFNNIVEPLSLIIE